MSEYIERRMYGRVNVNIPVKYREIISDRITAPEMLNQDSRCVNISRGGMQLITGRKWVGTDESLVETEFIMSGRAIRIIGRVVWHVSDPSGMCRSGLEFIVIKSGDLEVIGQIA
jgi:c-di-GMP-binding flagellar brake protein YcgR